MIIFFETFHNTNRCTHSGSDKIVGGQTAVFGKVNGFGTSPDKTHEQGPGF